MSNLLEILHRVSYKLKDVEDELQVFEIMYEALKEILPNVYFVITKLQPDDMNFRVVHSFGFEKSFSAIKNLLGIDPFQIDFPFSDLSNEKAEKFHDKSIYHFKGGIYDLVNGRINKTICKTIEKILGISEVYASSYFIENKYFGSPVYFIPKSSISSGYLNAETILAIENISFQASSAINTLRNYKALQEKEFELTNSQFRFNQLINQISDIVWKANGDGTNLIDLNNSFEKYYGYPASEFSKNPNLWLDVVHPEDKEIVQKASLELFKNGKTECEYRILRPDGNIYWLYDRKSVIFNEDGNPVQMGGIASDITEKKILEEQLKLRDYALDNSPTAIGFADVDGNISYINSAFLNLYGFDNKTEVVGKHITDFSTENDLPQILFDRILNGVSFIGEVKVKRRIGGLPTDCILSTSPIIQNQKLLCFVAFYVDITELNQTQQKLIENEQKLIEAQQIGNVGHWEYSFITEKIYCSDQLYKIYEVSKEDYAHDWGHLFTSIHLNNKETLRNSNINVIQEKLDFDLESKIVTAHGNTKNIVTRAKIKYDENRNPISILATVIDITDRKRIEEELEKSQEQLRNFTSHLLKVREKERTDISIEIHDSLAQYLVALKMDIGLYIKKIANKNKTVRSENIKIELEQFITQIDKTIKSARMIMNGLRPEQLEMLGFMEACETLVNNFEEIHHTKCKLDNKLANKIIHEEQSLILYRILQESFTNILKHANARRVNVLFSESNNKLLLEIVDNGVGFDEQSDVNSDSYGLVSMREQVKGLNGIFTINSKLGKGTKVRVELPFIV